MKIWTDPEFEQFTPNSKYLFIYLITNSHRNESALYSLSFKRISDETGLSKKTVESCMNELIEFGKVQYDREESVVWVVNAVRHQAMSENCARAIHNDLEHSSSSSLVTAFCSFYSSFKGLEGALEGLPNPSYRVQGIGYRVQGEEGGVGGEKVWRPTEKDFDALWEIIPNREGRKGALRHFYSSVKTTGDLADIQLALGNFSRAMEGRDPQYIKHGSTWFNNWRDWVNPTPAMMAAPKKAMSYQDDVHEHNERVRQDALRRKAAGL